MVEIHEKFAYGAMFNIIKEPNGGYDNITIVCYNDKQFLCTNLDCSCLELIPGTKYNVSILTNKNSQSRRIDTNLSFYTCKKKIFFLN